MRRIHAREIVSPEAELPYRTKARQKYSKSQHRQIVYRRVEKHQRNNDQSGDQEHAQQLATRHYSNCQKRQQKPAKQSAKLLQRLNTGYRRRYDRLTLRRWNTRIGGNKSRHDLRKLLNCSKRRTKAASKNQCCDQRRSPVLRLKYRAETWPFECARQFLLLPYRRF